MTNSNRVPEGVPTGGQFAASTKSESGVTLTPANPPGMAVGETTPVDVIEEGDYIVHEGRLHEVTGVSDDEGYDDDDGIVIETVCGDEGDEITFGRGDTVQKVDDSARYLYEEDTKIMFPERMFGAEFEERFGVIETPDRSQNWEDVPEDVPEDRVWSQVEGFADDGRYDYQLVPGYDSSALNYVITERPWTDADHARTVDSN